MVPLKISLQKIEWLKMRLAVPVGWEIARHSVQAEKGRLVFVDHRRQRLSLTWAACPKAPDIGQIFKDYRSRDFEEYPEFVFADLPRKFGWSGFRRRLGDEVFTRAGRYESGLKRWIEMTIPWAGEYDPQLEATLLRRFYAVENIRDLTRLSAFGLEVEAPHGWNLHAAEVKPADVRIAFRKGRSEVIVRRVGMSGNWFDGDLERFLKKQVAEGPVSLASTRYDGHPAALGKSREAGARIDRWLGRLRIRRDLVWHCPDGNEVLQIITQSRHKEPVSPEEWTVQSWASEGNNATESLEREITPSFNEEQTFTASAGRRQKPSIRLNGGEMLDAIPVPNVAVHTARTAAGELLLRVPLESRWYMNPPFSWIFPFSKDRAVALDRLGESVWLACDGEQSVERVVKLFAVRHRLSFHEARISVMQFLKGLTQRGFIAMVVGDREDAT